MRNRWALCGVAVFAAGCGAAQSGRGTRPPSETSSEGTPERMTPGTTITAQRTTDSTSRTQGVPSATASASQTTASQIMTGTFACLLGPIRLEQGGATSVGGGPAPVRHRSMDQGYEGQDTMGHDTTGQGTTVSQGAMGHGAMMDSAGMNASAAGGLTPERCRSAAQAANVLPNALERADSSALDAVRRLVEARLSSGAALSEASSNALAFFDRGTSAAKEAQLAHEAFFGVRSGLQDRTGQTAGSSSALIRGADDARAHRSLDLLYQFGRSLGSIQSGAEAQALAWIIAVDRFTAVRHVPAQQKSLAAEPLLSGILNVAPPPSTTGATSDWNQYVATAARELGAMSASGSARAIGGGPSAAAENANLTPIRRTSEERLKTLQQQLAPSSDYRIELDRTLTKLRTF